jgi:DEAD/DEAH box helicase domain-containing protein
LADLEGLLERLRLEGDMASNVTSWQAVAARSAEYGPMPTDLDPRLVKQLAAQGIEHLYMHQSEAVRQVLGGRHVVVVTPTASGKTLCYNLPVLNALLQDPATRALYLFPTKALAHDQLEGLQAFAEALALDATIAAYDGDTPQGRRAKIRQSASVIVSNPDMLHVGILPYHTRWRGFFANLRYVVIDEMHTYRGIFGSHVANVLRRLRRIRRFYGSAPQFICCSATIANPVELAQKLIGRPVSMVSQNGAPRGRRHLVFYNPPIINQRLGIRRSALLEARTLANRLLNADVQTVVFCRSRMAVEQLLIYLRQDARRAGRDPGAIRGYRGGYLATERRDIEEGLRQGGVRGVVATNALELGVDIGGLSACIMAGYPGTIASTWQRAGRAGRGVDVSVAFLVASSSPLDQYIISHPHYFLGQSPEHALINPDNIHLLLDHVGCAASELPFANDESYGGEDVQAILGFLAKGGRVHKSRERWYWAGGDQPAGGISLRTAEGDRVVIAAEQEGREYTAQGEGRRIIGQTDRASAPFMVHTGAIYMHEGQQYLVNALDWDAGVAAVEPVSVDYYTEASRSTRVEIEQVLEQQHRPNIHLDRGEIRLTTRVTGYRRLRLGTLEHLGWGEVDLPEQEMLTSACWVAVPEEVVARLRDEGWWVGERGGSRGRDWEAQRDRARRRDGYRCRWCNAEERPSVPGTGPGRAHDVHHIVPFREFKWVPGQNDNYRQANRLSNLITLCPRCHRQAEQQVAVRSTLSGLGRVTGHLIPLYLMCDSRDVGILTDVQAPQTGLPTIFIYDGIPGGVGLSDEVPALYGELLEKAAELVSDCPCEFGCPSCIGPAAQDNPRAKQQVLRLIEALRG